MALAQVATAEARYAALLSEGLSPRAAWTTVVAEYGLHRNERDALRKRVARNGLPAPGSGRCEDSRTRDAVSLTQMSDLPVETAGALAIAATGVDRRTCKRALDRHGITRPIRLEQKRIVGQVLTYAQMVLARCDALYSSLLDRNRPPGWVINDPPPNVVTLIGLAEAAIAAAGYIGDTERQEVWRRRSSAAHWVLKQADRSYLPDLGGRRSVMRDMLGIDSVLHDAGRALSAAARLKAEADGLPVPYMPPSRGDGVLRPPSQQMDWPSLARLRPDVVERAMIRRAKGKGPEAERALRDRLELRGAENQARKISRKIWSKNKPHRTNKRHSSRGTPSVAEIAQIRRRD